jgi:hypothetical protein
VSLTSIILLLPLLGEGKKGGNTVASAIWQFLDIKKLRNGRTAAEINLVFDNCAGQNKNRMVSRMLFYLVKLKICRVARAIFLIKGHTKNDCDRMFNLMKYDYRKVNCYTPPELLVILNKHPQVTAIPLQQKHFLNWDKLENTMISKVDTILKNHIFTVSDTDSNRMAIQEFAGAVVELQLLVLKAHRETDWQESFELERIPPPGLADIKWNELYKKWGKFVPEDKKHGLVYFCKEPSEEVRKMIAKQSAKAKAVRHERTHAAGKKEPKEEPKVEKPPKITGKKRGRPKKE